MNFLMINLDDQYQSNGYDMTYYMRWELFGNVRCFSSLHFLAHCQE